ncbi:MAG: cation:H+ antiporter, partial [Candidatus Binatia bacterium]
MLISWLWIVLGVGLLYVGAESLVRGSASIARRQGLSPLVIGLTVVAFGTSMPEMVVSLGAIYSGSDSIALGNVVGSNIGNIALILGVTALVSPPSVNARVLRVDLPLLVVVTLAFSAALYDWHLGRAEGVMLLAGLVAYTAFNLRLARTESKAVVEEFADGVPKMSGSTASDFGRVAVGLLLLIGGARALVSGAVVVAGAFGLSEAAIGLTVVALGTSMPELATSVVAASKGEGDIAIGNVLGSNLYNILCIAGTAATIHPMNAAGITTVDLAVMIGLTAVLLPLMGTGNRVGRREGMLLVVVYVSY